MFLLKHKTTGHYRGTVTFNPLALWKRESSCGLLSIKPEKKLTLHKYSVTIKEFVSTAIANKA